MQDSLSPAESRSSRSFDLAAKLPPEPDIVTGNWTGTTPGMWLNPADMPGGFVMKNWGFDTSCGRAWWVNAVTWCRGSAVIGRNNNRKDK